MVGVERCSSRQARHLEMSGYQKHRANQLQLNLCFLNPSSSQASRLLMSRFRSLQGCTIPCKPWRTSNMCRPAQSRTLPWVCLQKWRSRPAASTKVLGSGEEECRSGTNDWSGFLLDTDCLRAGVWGEDWEGKTQRCLCMDIFICSPTVAAVHA